jgi:Holliday junction resolvasome RuvABC ATP-dependent DNA helicase subunit
MATDQPGQLLQALYKRMEHKVSLIRYSQDELYHIGYAVASESNVLFSPQAMRKLVDAAQGQPRRALQIIKGIKTHNYAVRHPQFSVDDVRK